MTRQIHPFYYCTVNERFLALGSIVMLLRREKLLVRLAPEFRLLVAGVALAGGRKQLPHLASVWQAGVQNNRITVVLEQFADADTHMSNSL